MAVRAGVARDEPSLAAARRIEQHPVERRAQAVAQAAPVVHAHLGDGDALAGQVEAEPLGAHGTGVVGQDVAPVLHHRGHLGGLAAGRRRHVEHPFPGSGLQHERRDHAGQALQVEPALLVGGKRFELGLPSVLDDERLRVPGHPLDLHVGLSQLGQERAHVGLQRVDAQRGGAGLAHAGQDAPGLRLGEVPVQAFHERVGESGRLARHRQRRPLLATPYLGAAGQGSPLHVVDFPPRKDGNFELPEDALGAT